MSIFGGSIGNSPTEKNEPAKFSFATGLPFTPPEKSAATTTTPTWKFGIDTEDDTEPDSTNDRSNEGEPGNPTDSNPDVSNESERDLDSNDVPVSVSESDKSSDLTNTSAHNNEPDSTEKEEDDSRSKDLD